MSLNIELLNYINYLIDGRKWDAPLNPTRLYYIDPEIINVASNNKPSCPVVFSRVLDGKWDTNLRKVKNDIVYTSMKDHFIDEKPWKETPYYNFLIKKKNNTEFEWGLLNNSSDIEERLEYIDKLYQNIKNNGYKKQSSINNNAVGKINAEILLPDPYKEINIDISRDGKVLWATGMHRLCIAKLVGSEKVPVRIRVRHKKWQLQREKYTNQEYRKQKHFDLDF